MHYKTLQKYYAILRKILPRGSAWTIRKLASLSGVLPVKSAQTIESRHHVLITVTPPLSILEEKLLIYGIYDEGVLLQAQTFLSPDDLVLDIGANIGWYSLNFSNWLGKSGSVISFEPSKRNCDRLLDNARANGFDNIRIEHCALGDREDTVPLFMGADDDCGGFRLTQNTSQLHEMTQMNRLDTLLNSEEKNHVSIIKIDVEGSEPLVIKGGAETFASPSLKLVLIELGHKEQGLYPSIEALKQIRAWSFFMLDADDCQSGDLIPFSDHLTVPAWKTIFCIPK